MLEELAYDYINLSEDGLYLTRLLSLAVGGLIAGVTNKSTYRMRRAPYFANSALIFFGVSLSTVIWFASIPAMLGGYLWVVMTIDIAITIAAGYFVGLIAMARSRDAYGTNGSAVLAFIPVANFWLLFTRSQSPVDDAYDRGLLGGATGVIVGLFLLLLGAASSVGVEQALLNRAERPGSAVQGMELMLRANGLEETLRLLAEDAGAPIQTDEITTLASVEGQGNELIRTYVVSRDIGALSFDYRVNTRATICGHPPFAVLLDAGATFHEQYLTSEGRIIGSIVITAFDCP